MHVNAVGRRINKTNNHRNVLHITVGPVGVLRHDVARPSRPVHQHDRGRGLGHDHAVAAVAGHAEIVAQLRRPRGRDDVAHVAPAVPAPLLDHVRVERRVHPSGPVDRARDVRQPTAVSAAQRHQLHPTVHAGPEQLPAVAPVRARVPQPAQPHRDQPDRQPAGHDQERHVRQVPQTATRVHGR